MDILEEGNGAPFSIICRICLKAKQGMKSVYSATIPDMLMYCVSLKVEHGDGLPNLICSQCLKQINQSFSFKQLCEKSESLLKQYLPLKIIPAQDLTVEDVTQNQILDTLEDPTLTSTSFIPNEPFDEQDLVESENLIPLVTCLPQFEDSSLFNQDVDLETDQNIYNLKDVDFSDNYLDVTDNSWTESIERSIEISLGTKDTYLHSGVADTQTNYSCVECKESFICYEDLSVHMSIHSPRGHLQCNACNKVFHKKESLKRHVKRHMKNKPLNCSVCDKRFSDKCDLKRHTKRHAAQTEKHRTCIKCGKVVHSCTCTTSYACQLCSASFIDKRLLKAHYSIHMNEKNILSNGVGITYKVPIVKLERANITEVEKHMCDVCGKEFPQAVNLRNHLKSHNPESSFSCHLCSNHTYKRMSSLKEHIAKAHPDMEESSTQRKCEVCNQIFHKVSELLMHRAVHKNQQYKCYVCNKAFPQKYKRKRHMLCHMKKGEIDEVNCNYILEKDAFSGQNPYEQELYNAVANITEKVALPNDNTVEYTTLSNVDVMAINKQKSEQVLNTHSQPMNMDCSTGRDSSKNIGNLSFQDDSASSISVSSQNDQKFLNIAYCDSTNTPTTLNARRLSVAHNEELINPINQIQVNSADSLKGQDEEYTCKICKTKVREHKDLSVHMSLHPINSESWECNLCQKKFSKRTFLSRHIKIHMAREMYPCAHCTKRFYEKSKLRKHIIKSHPEVSETPPTSSEEEKSQTSINGSKTPIMVDGSLLTTIDMSHISLTPMDICQVPTVNSSRMSADRAHDQQMASGLEDKINNTNSQLVLNSSNTWCGISPPILSSHSEVSPVLLDINAVQNTITSSQQVPESSSATDVQYTCDVCGKSFSKAIKLSLHMRSHNHSQELETIFTCHICNQTFLDLTSLESHSQTHNTQTKQTKCLTCNLSFNTLTEFTAHTKSTHNSPSKVVPLCKVCGKTFTSMYKRRKHMQTHKIVESR